MDELIALLQSFGLPVTDEALAHITEDSDEGRAARATYFGTLDDARLEELQTALFEMFDSTRDGDVVDIEALEAIADAGEAIRLEDGSRQDQAQADAEHVADLARRLRPDAPAASDTGDGDDEPAGDEPADEPAGDDGGADEPAGDEPAGDAAAADEPELVTASVTPRRVALTDLAAHRRASQTPAADQGAGEAERQVVITAGGDIPGVTAGQPLDDLDAVAAATRNRVLAVDGILPVGQKVIVARARNVYPEERTLNDTNPTLNAQRVEVVVASAREAFLAGGEGTMDALAAAGGRCGPLPARFDVETLGTDARPIASGLVSFTDARGGVRFVPGPVLSDVDITGSDAAISQWTNAQDTAAINDTGTRKAIQRIICADEVTVEDYAVVKRLLVGTALARTNPERLRAMIDLVNVAHARMAEGLLLTRIKSALGTQVGESGQVLGSRRDLLAEWIKAAWGIRNHYRMADADVLQLVVPDAVVAHAQIDGVRQMPGDQRDRLTRDEVVGELRAIGVDVIISPDFPSHIAPAQVSGTQLRDLPAPIEWAMFPMGTLAYIDGGDFDLGFSAGTPIRDTATLAANDYQLFGENWETVAKFGGAQVLWGRTMVAPTGEVAGTVDVSVDTAS